MSCCPKPCPECPPCLPVPQPAGPTTAAPQPCGPVPANRRPKIAPPQCSTCPGVCAPKCCNAMPLKSPIIPPPRSGSAKAINPPRCCPSSRPQPCGPVRCGPPVKPPPDDFHPPIKMPPPRMQATYRQVSAFCPPPCPPPMIAPMRGPIFAPKIPAFTPPRGQPVACNNSPVNAATPSNCSGNDTGNAEQVNNVCDQQNTGENQSQC